MSYFLTIANTGDEKFDCVYEQVGNALDKAIEIVKQESEQYNGGWISCSERLPELLEDITKDEDTFLKSCYLVTDGVFVCQAIFDEHGEFIDTLDFEPLIVTAWKPLPEPYQQKG